MSLLEARVAWVTGGAAGLGLAVARRFASEGARVMVADVREDACRAACAAAAQDGLELVPATVDVTDEASVEASLDTCAGAFGREPDVVVANAGILRLAPVTETALEDWRAVLNVNLTGAFLTVRAAARRLVEAGRAGSISLTSSVAGVRGLRENAAYSASKFGVIGLTEVCAAELGPAGIRVNAVCPGQIASAMLDDAIAAKAEARQVDAGALRAEMLAAVPMGRLGTAEEVADTFVYLASPLSKYVTGRSFVVDGGWTLT